MTPLPPRPANVAAKAQAMVNTVRSGPSLASINTLRTIILWQTLVILVLTLAICYAKFNIPRDPLPFAVNTKSGEPQPLLGLRQATKTQQAILSWVGSAAADILNFGFHNIYERLDGTRKYFTDDGWDSFKEAVIKADIIQRVTEKQQVITAAPIGTPVIISTKPNVQYGKEWTVQVPISLTVLSGKETESQRRTLTLVLVNVSPDQNLSGLGIDRWLDTQ